MVVHWSEDPWFDPGQASLDKILKEYEWLKLLVEQTDHVGLSLPALHEWV